MIKINDRIHLHSRNGVYTVIAINGNFITLTTNTMRHTGESFLIHSSDYKCHVKTPHSNKVKDDSVLLLLLNEWKQREERLLEAKETLKVIKTVKTDSTNAAITVDKTEVLKSYKSWNDPFVTSNRFICGFSDDELEEKDFEMIFWKGHFKEVENSHSSLESFFKKVSGKHLYYISGGFYYCEKHNNNNGNKVYLFGKSQTYSGFDRYKDKILEYGTKHNVNFIFKEPN